MILVDSRVGSKELAPYLHRLGFHAELTMLEFGDAAFEGNGPEGKLCIGIERKTLGDMLSCIEDARYAAHQRPGMIAMYTNSILIIEGIWKPDSPSGYLLECVATLNWRPYRHRTQMVRYSKLFRYLLSVQFSGVTVIWSRDVENTAYNIAECYQYFQKPWADHTSLLETQTLNIPSLTGKPSLVRRWAAELTGVGVKNSLEAAKIFRSPYELAIADEMGWIKVPKIGAKLARSIVKEIHGSD